MNKFKQFSSFLHKFYTNSINWKCGDIKKSYERSFGVNFNMSSDSSLKPPDSAFGLTELKRELFNKTVDLPVLTLTGIKPSSVIPNLKQYLLKMEKFKPIRKSNNQDSEVYEICLNPDVIQKWEDLDENHRTVLEKLSIKSADLSLKSFEIGYDNFSAENILKAVLPRDKEGVSSFTQVGHIVHVNLREHLLPFKKLIGEVLYNKVAGCRTVVNKLDIIDNTYRNFQMEVLQGDVDFLTQIKENKCVFEFDFSKVYWNSRLCTEHERIVNLLQPGDVLFDVFAGVGPFSIPAAKKNVKVYSNDLNPESYKWLKHNTCKNKIKEEYLETFNKDGRDFILNEIKLNLVKHTDVNQIYIVMNLPALAVEFVNAFIGLYESSQRNIDFKSPPIVVLYCFTKGENPEELTKQLLNENFGFNVEDKILSIFKVRTVSSMKEMMRIMFKLDRDILTKHNLKKRKFDEVEGVEILPQ